MIKPFIFSRVRRFARWVSPKVYFTMVVSIKAAYFKMFMYAMPSSSLEGLVILYGLLIVVFALRVPEECRQTGYSDLILWLLGIGFVWGLDWLIIYLSRPGLPVGSI